MADTKDLEEALSELTTRLDRVEALIQRETPEVPDGVMLNYEEASIFFVTSQNPHWLSTDEVDRAKELLAEHQMSPQKMQKLCLGETAAYPYRVKVGQSALIPAEAVKEYKRRLKADQVKARHRC